MRQEIRCHRVQCLLVLGARPFHTVTKHSNNVATKLSFIVRDMLKGNPMPLYRATL